MDQRKIEINKEDENSVVDAKEDENPVDSGEKRFETPVNFEPPTRSSSVQAFVYEGVSISSSQCTPVKGEESLFDTDYENVTQNFSSVNIDNNPYKSEQRFKEEPLKVIEKSEIKDEPSKGNVKIENQSPPRRANKLNPPHSPLGAAFSSTQKGNVRCTPLNWPSDLSQNPLKVEKPRIVVIVWEVSHLWTENQLSAQAFGSAGIPTTDANDASIRRGLHDIFDLNLGFETMNSLSCLKVDEDVLCEKLGIPTGLPQHQLFDHLRARIDLLIRFGLYSNGAYTDYRRACLWLATLSHLRNDLTPLTPRSFSAPFVLLLAKREDLFYPNRVFYQIPPQI